MATVNVRPMPEALRAVSPRFRHQIPPTFPDGKPTEADRELARDLFTALDPASREWYRGNSPALFAGLETKT